ncbi:MAG: prepilin-type N-terminal cleavage/methylation domain-containing protein [Oscillospiraceae bacterium]|nr:prepilin-type N-terminal cleavage/methylation domain-containing protein [Oscillospiraceae bacterium]
MKKKNRAILNNKGESIIECLVSLVILTILLTGISAMINASLHFTTLALRRAEERQSNANEVAEHKDGDDSYTMILKGNFHGEPDFEIKINGITVTENDDFIAFEPPPPPTPPSPP